MSALDRLKKRGRASFQDPQSPSSSDAANVLAQAARIASSGEDRRGKGDSASPVAKKARTVDDAHLSNAAMLPSAAEMSSASSDGSAPSAPTMLEE